MSLRPRSIFGRNIQAKLQGGREALIKAYQALGSLKVSEVKAAAIFLLFVVDKVPARLA